MADRRKQVLGTLVALSSRLPVPDGRWHPYADAIAAVRADFEHALLVVSGVPEVLELVDTLYGGSGSLQLSEHAGPDLRAAWSRLENLAVPAGRHPFLDEIVAALDALRTTLVAISRDDVAARRFELAQVAAAA